MNKDVRTIGQLAKHLHPGMRVCISFEWWKDEDGNQKWTSPLSDAQFFAYQEHRILHGHERAGTWYCIIGDPEEEHE